LNEFFNTWGRAEACIKQLTRELIDEFAAEMGWSDPRSITLDIEQIYESVIYPQCEYQVNTGLNLGFSDGHKVLGKTVPTDRIVLVDRTVSPQSGDPRFPFTMAHEFGHAYLHSKLLPLSGCTGPAMFGKGRREKMEVEANRFAANLLMPDHLVRLQFKRRYSQSSPIVYRGPKTYWLPNWGTMYQIPAYTYTDFCRVLARPLRMYFSNVSMTSLGLKLHQLGLVGNETEERFNPEL